MTGDSGTKYIKVAANLIGCNSESRVWVLACRENTCLTFSQMFRLKVVVISEKKTEPGA